MQRVAMLNNEITCVATMALRARAVAQYMCGASWRVSSCFREAESYCLIMAGVYLARGVTCGSGKGTKNDE